MRRVLSLSLPLPSVLLFLVSWLAFLIREIEKRHDMVNECVAKKGKGEGRHMVLTRLLQQCLFEELGVPNVCVVRVSSAKS